MGVPSLTHAVVLCYTFFGFACFLIIRFDGVNTPSGSLPLYFVLLSIIVLLCLSPVSGSSLPTNYITLFLGQFLTFPFPLQIFD